MESILRYLLEHADLVVSALQFGLFTVLSVFLFRKTGNIKYIDEVIEEMKYRTKSYVETETGNVSPGSATFSGKSQIYRLNKASGVLEATCEYVDIQALIESCRDQCMDKILERLMPGEPAPSVVTYTGMIDDIDVMQEGYAIASQYREQYGLPDTMSMTDVFKYVQAKADELGRQLDVQRSSMIRGGEQVETSQTNVKEGQ